MNSVCLIHKWCLHSKYGTIINSTYEMVTCGACVVVYRNVVTGRNLERGVSNNGAWTCWRKLPVILILLSFLLLHVYFSELLSGESKK